MSPFRRPHATLALACVLASSTRAAAQTLDSSGAREQLKLGYELKQKGQYAEALPHLQESLRLDAQVKTLINLADCEEHVGKLVDAQRHWVEARDRAAVGKTEAARAEAQRRLDALEARIPRLTVRFSAERADGTEVLRDGVPLGAVSLGTAMPLDPGEHEVVVRAIGRQPRTFAVRVKESERAEVVVEPGAAAAALPTEPSPPAPAAPAATTRAAQGAERAPSLPLRTFAWGAGAAGLALLGTGVYFGVKASSEWSDAQSACAKGCADHVERVDTVTSHGTLSTAFFIAGGVLSAASVTLLVLSSPSAAPRVGFRVGPTGVQLSASF